MTLQLSKATSSGEHVSISGMAATVHEHSVGDRGSGPLNIRKAESWPAIGNLGLTESELATRLRGVGGSDANVILSGDADRITRLWLEKRGGTQEDLSDRIQVALGCWTEEFNRQWFEKISGETISRVPDALVCTEHPWRRCTLDGYIEAKNAVWEAKHTSAFAKSEDILERYMPQLQHNIAIAKADSAILSVIYGNHKFEIFEVASDWLYQIDLFEAEQTFWQCVLDGSPPAPAAVPASPKAIGVREVCLEGNNRWAVAACDWLANRDAAKSHSIACAELKVLIEDDVARAFGHGIEAKRSKSGAVTIRALAQ
jgi:hypothetical protein